MRYLWGQAAAVVMALSLGLVSSQSTSSVRPLELPTAFRQVVPPSVAVDVSVDAPEFGLSRKLTFRTMPGFWGWPLTDRPELTD